jgi:hypothetical protein
MDKSMLQVLVDAQRALLGALNVQGEGGPVAIITAAAPSFRYQEEGLLTIDQMSALIRRVGNRINPTALRLLFASWALSQLGDIITPEDAWEYGAQVKKPNDIAVFRKRVSEGVDALDAAQSALGLAKAERAVKAEANRAESDALQTRLAKEWALVSAYGMTAAEFTEIVTSVVEGSLVTV